MYAIFYKDDTTIYSVLMYLDFTFRPPQWVVFKQELTPEKCLQGRLILLHSAMPWFRRHKKLKRCPQERNYGNIIF